MNQITQEGGKADKVDRQANLANDGHVFLRCSSSGRQFGGYGEQQSCSTKIESRVGDLSNEAEVRINAFKN
jgi:hypothetical protein